MASQKGIVKLKGTLGDIVFYKSGDGYLARERGSLNAKRIASDPAFQRTRENGSEFGRAGRAGKVLRAALRTLLQQVADRKMVSRLTKQMLRVIKADATSLRGERNVIDGEAELLEGFQFNADSSLDTTLFAPYTVNIDRSGGKATVSIPPFLPGNMVQGPSGTTHFKIVSAAAEIDFESETFLVSAKETELIPWNTTTTSEITLDNSVPANSKHPLFVALGIEFFQVVNGKQYGLKNGTFNALALVKVSGS